MIFNQHYFRLRLGRNSRISNLFLLITSRQNVTSTGLIACTFPDIFDTRYLPGKHRSTISDADLFPITSHSGNGGKKDTKSISQVPRILPTYY